MNSPVDQVLIAYVATPHAGYLKLFRKYPESTLYVLGDEFIRQVPSLVRHLPGVRPEEARQMIQALGIFSDVRILTLAGISEVRKAGRIIMPDEDVAHVLAANYFASMDVVYDGSWRLRWDWGAVVKERRPESERVVSVEEFDREIMRRSFNIADRSPDWWRQIGALLVKDGEVLLVAFNRHIPSEQSAYCYGDPRSQFEAGQSIETSGAAHAEMVLLAEAARRGVVTEGCDLYVTTFPCPPCASTWSFTGIKCLFYVEGYSLVAGAETLEAKGVEIVRVEM